MCGYVSARIAVAMILIVLALGFVWILMPQTEYLPEGNREILFGILLPPPGYNLEELENIARIVEADIVTAS
jgi:hydrophobic/amphiphilic exporter-1 (mainly G- bacteria), HAE1 family